VESALRVHSVRPRILAAPDWEFATDTPQHDPKEPIDGGQSRVWMATRQDREFLP
jgi:hypothetical protein